MKFWNYIGGIFLLRWLSGEFKHRDSLDGMSDLNNGQSFGNDAFEDNNVFSANWFNHYHQGYSSHNPYDSSDYGWQNQSFSDFCNGQDDYGMMDDF